MARSPLSGCKPALTLPEIRLLLICARPTLSADQTRLAGELLPQVKDWPGFIDTAQRKFALPLVFQNLAGLADTVLPAPAHAEMRRLAMNACAERLSMQAAFERFHARCVLPSGVPHVYFKGPALARRFYPDPLMRPFRDIDILVPQAARAGFIRGLLAQGGRLLRKTDRGMTALGVTSEGDLRALLAAREVPLVMMAPDLVVEIHVAQDLRSRLFIGTDLLRDPERVALTHHSINAMRDLPHIALSLHHHTRHLWSKLNWLADLDAICSHPDFDREALLAYAARLRMGRTVEAALELHALAAAGHHPSDFSEPTPGREMLRACVEGLNGDVPLEMAMRRAYGQGLRAFGWQEMPLSRAEALRLRLRPGYDDFPRWPRALPFWLRHMTAVATRITSEAWRRLTRRLGREGSKG